MGNLIRWLIGLAQALEKATPAQMEAAKIIYEAIGKDGAGGVAKVIMDYNSNNPLEIGALELPLLIEVNGQEIPVKVKLDLPPMAQGVLAVMILTAGLSAG